MHSHRSILFLVIACASIGPQDIAAQQEVEAVLEGLLSVSGVPADTGTVVLHRVTPEEAAQLDSVQVADGGAFSFRLPNLPIPGSGEVYFASTRYDGIVYSGTYVTDPVQLDSVYILSAHPARSSPPQGYAFPISQREIWISEGPIGWRVTDVIEIVNPDSTTLVPGEDGGSVWRYPLPPQAVGAQVLPGGIGPVVGPAQVEGTVLAASNPVVPDRNFYIVQYDLESLEFDVPMPGETRLVQLLVREPAPEIRVEGLARQPTEEIEVGSTFLRWAGQSLQDQTIAVRFGAEDAGAGAWLFVVATLSLVLAGVGSLVVRRRPIAVGVGSVRTRKDILVDIATLDEAFARLENPGEQDETKYRRERADLLRELHRKEVS